MITYRCLTKMSEFQEAISVQKAVWGFDDVEVIPARLFAVSVKVGGQMIGAYDGGRLIGYSYSIPGIKNGGGENYLHSHMTGVLEEYQNQGVGRGLKLEQRAEALGRGIRLVEWTFDPLEIKNAYFNIERLGVIVRRYIRNAYGITTSKLHSGMPTDRCVAEWRLDHPRVVAAIEGRPRERVVVEARIEIPAAIYEIRSADVPQALRIQSEATDNFERYFEAGLSVIGFERTAEHGAYLFGKWE